MTEMFTYRSKMPASAEAVYRFHTEPGALERLTPPWEKSQVVARTGSIEQPGSQVTLRVSVGPFSQNWIAEHVAVLPNQMFRDIMRTGPPSATGSTLTNSFLKMNIPVGSKTPSNMNFLSANWGNCLAVPTHRRLQRLFEWRHKVTAGQLAASAANTGLHF
jgi:hypothetical protein